MHFRLNVRVVRGRQPKVVRGFKVGVRLACGRVVDLATGGEPDRRPTVGSRGDEVGAPERGRIVEGDRWIARTAPGVHPHHVGARVPGGLDIVSHLAGARVGDPWVDDIGVVFGGPPAVVATGEVRVQEVSATDMVGLVLGDPHVAPSISRWVQSSSHCRSSLVLLSAAKIGPVV